jgi:hypothetical protein
MSDSCMSFQTPKDCKERNAIHPRRDPRTKSNDFQPHEHHTKTKQDQVYVTTPAFAHLPI